MKNEPVEMSKTGGRVLDGPGPPRGLGKPEPGNTSNVICFDYQSGLLFHTMCHIHDLLTGAAAGLPTEHSDASTPIS